MTAWRVVEDAEPEFARRVRTPFAVGRHETMAALRADGSPRITGIESVFADGELFTADIVEVVITHLDAGATRLVIGSWTPGRGLRTVERDQPSGAPLVPG